MAYIQENLPYTQWELVTYKLHFHSFIAGHCANTMYVNKRVPLLPGIIPPLAPIHTNRIRALMTGRAQHCTGQLMHLFHTMPVCKVSILDLQCRLLKNVGLFSLITRNACFFFPSPSGTLKLFTSNPNANQSFKPSQQQKVHNYKHIILYHLFPPTTWLYYGQSKLLKRISSCDGSNVLQGSGQAR